VIGDWLYEHFEAYVPDPDRDGYRAVRAPKMKHTPPDPQQVSKPKYEATAPQALLDTSVCFTTCSDLNGYRAPKMKYGMGYVSRYVCSLVRA